MTVFCSSCPLFAVVYVYCTTPYPLCSVDCMWSFLNCSEAGSGAAEAECRATFTSCSDTLEGGRGDWRGLAGAPGLDTHTLGAGDMGGYIHSVKIYLDC